MVDYPPAMDTTEQDQAAPEADDSEQSGAPAQTVRVPNVSPGAKSGLDHTIIGSDALAPDDDAADQDDADDDPSMPQGDPEGALAWVRDAEDSDTAKQRADQVWKAYGDGNDASDLATNLRTAVYGESDDDTPASLTGNVEVPAGLTGEDLDTWVSGDAVEGDETTNPERYAAYLARKQAAYGDGDLSVDPDSPVPGVVAQTDAPVGDAENADTGVVTPAGDPLPDAPDPDATTS